MHKPREELKEGRSGRFHREGLQSWVSKPGQGSVGREDKVGGELSRYR